MGILTDIADNALEGYARGINPRYAAKQDAREKSSIMERIVQELGSYSAQDPLLLSRAMIGSGHPEIQEAGMLMQQQYESGKTSDVKEFEWSQNLPADKLEEWRNLRGQGFKLQGEPRKALNSKGEAVWVQTLADSMGNIKQITFPGGVNDPHVLPAGGGREYIANTGSTSGGWEVNTLGGGGAFNPGGQGIPRGGNVPQNWPTPAMGAARENEARMQYLAQMEEQARAAQGAVGGPQAGPARVVPGSAVTAPRGDPRAVAGQGAGVASGSAPVSSSIADPYGRPPYQPGMDQFARNEFDSEYNNQIASGLAKEALAREANFEKAKGAVESMNQSGANVSEAINEAANILSDPTVNSTGHFVAWRPKLFGSELPVSQPTANVSAIFNTIKADLGVEMLKKIEDAGFSLAPISNFDAEAMQSAVANLDPHADEQQNYKHLKIIKKNYDALIEGLNKKYAEKYPNDTEFPNMLAKYPKTQTVFHDWNERRAEALKTTQKLKDRDFVTTPIREWLKGKDSGTTVVESLENDIRNFLSSSKESSGNALEDVKNYLSGQGRADRVDMMPNITSTKGFLANRVIDSYQITDRKNQEQIRKMPIKQLLEMLENVQRDTPYPFGTPMTAQ